MFLLKKLIASWLLPPFGLLTFALVLLLFARRTRIGVALIFVSVTTTLALCLPIVADKLSRPLEGVPVSDALIKQGQVIVVLGGGIRYDALEYGGDTVSKASLERVRYGAKLAHETKLPILVTGGVVYGGQAEGTLMKAVLENEFNAPVKWVEAQSRNTAENAEFSTRLLKDAGIQRILLVTHAWHMPRAKANFEKYGLTVIAAPTGFTPREVSLLESLLPSSGAFERSANAIHEWVGKLIAN